jgi:hypothetical protein
LQSYILVNCIPKMVWEIAEAALKIEGVRMAHAVTGQFDVIAYAEFASMDTLREIIGEFMDINGVQRTQTAIVISPGLA